MLKVFSALFSLILISSSYACALKQDKKLVSLAAPITSFLEELHLLDDPALDSISVFHATKNKKVKRLAGGIFLSAKSMSKYRNHVIFYDASRELQRLMKKSSIVNAIEVDTRGIDPFDANEKSLALLSPYLSGCKKKLEKLNKKIAAIKVKVAKLKFGERAYVFFLGEFKKGQRPPELVMVNDGFVRYLAERNQMKTYPGDLAYVPWSQRVLSKLGNRISIGISESSDEELNLKKVSANVFNISKMGALSPGLGQVYFLEDFSSLNFLSELSE